MFSLPAIYGSTPIDRNKARLREIDQLFEQAHREFDAALVRLRDQQIGFDEVTDQNGEFTKGGVQNLAASGGSAVDDIMRAVQDAHKSLLKVAVLAGGFEATE